MAKQGNHDAENWREKNTELKISSTYQQTLILIFLVSVGLISLMISDKLNTSSNYSWWVSLLQSVGTGLFSSVVFYWLVDLNIRRRFETKIRPLSKRLDVLVICPQRLGQLE